MSTKNNDAASNLFFANHDNTSKKPPVSKKRIWEGIAIILFIDSRIIIVVDSDYFKPH